ncbi:MAG: bifunctional SulP family inorganic anion transporter/carbonic anhydrase [Planctomycetes bacterium]|nr:bifunctional SulP family inorganic anion transporter/carbonic anhydrase [Planctomycetota bacterium]
MAPNTTHESKGSRVARDLIAGVVVFFVALPLCLGIALASGAPPQAGLLAGIIGGLVVGVLSGSHVSVTGPAAGLAAIVVAQIGKLGSFEAFLTAVLLSGVLQIVFGAIRAGGMANYFPNSVIKGLLAAIGILLILKQVPHLLGHDADYEGDMTFEQADGQNTFTALSAAMQALLPGAALVGLSSLVLLLAWDRTRLKKALFPSALAAVLLGTAINELLRAIGSPWVIAPSHLVSVPVVSGEAGWSSLLHAPDLARVFDPVVLMAALTLAVVASLETLLNLEATDRLDPLRRTSPPNRELLAQGVGNILAGSIGALPVTSVIVRSSVNVNAGNRTRLSAIVHGLLLLISVGLMAGLINRIPLAALAAVLVVTGFKLASPKLFRSMWQEGWSQIVPFLVTVVAIVTTDLLIGVLIGLATSVVFVLLRNLHGGFQLVREDHVAGVVQRIEFASQTNFISRAHIAKQLGDFREGDEVVLDARNADYIDPDVMALIREFVDETAPARGVRVSTVGFKDRYPLDDVIQFVDFASRELLDSLSPDRVLQVLKEGNQRFVDDRRLKRDLVRQVDATSSGQHPMAVVLSCIDSRAPAELLFDLGIGDIFSVRVAGNVARDKVIGSMEYGCKVVGSKLIVVLGHTRCGAVNATCDFVARDVDPVVETGLHNLPAITSVITEAVRSEHAVSGAGGGDREAFADRVAARHVHNTIDWIRGHSDTLRHLLDQGTIGIIGAMYDVKTGRVEWFEQRPLSGLPEESLQYPSQRCTPS